MPAGALGGQLCYSRHWGTRRRTPGMGERLLLAYTTLMNKAPGAAFRRARELYLNKYCVPQGNTDHPLRLFVCDEQTDESEAPAPDGQPGHRLVTLTSRPGQLAIVHWQRTFRPTTSLRYVTLSFI